MKLSPFFSDGMVLQRDACNYIKGFAKAGSRIVMKVKDMRIEGQADAEGRFELILPPFSAESGVSFFIEEISSENGNPKNIKVIKDAAFGDVFMLSGQSNMELPILRTLDVTGEEVADSDYPLIREFTVPMEYDFMAQRRDLTGGEWKCARGQDLLQISAAGFFMARALFDTYQIPIGLIRTALGGTPIEAWCSEKTIMHYPEFREEVKQCREPGYIEGIQKEEEEHQKRWYELAEQFSDTPRGKRGEIIVPGLWEDTELSDFHGSLIVEREFYLNEASGESARIYLGTIVDADKVYINGHLVGKTDYRYPPRKYDFPSSYLRKGCNHIRIEMLVFRNTGGFIPGKPYYVSCGAEVVSLGGVWDYKIVITMPQLPDATFFQYKATGVFNGMLSPFAGHSIKAMVFYQGESNTDAPENYGKYFDSAITDWRELFQNEKLPIIYVQLAGFADSRMPCTETKWAVLRNEQRKALKNPYTAMVSAIDIGEYNDLHPQDKLTLGKRLALAIQKSAYNEDIVDSGPLYAGMQVEGDKCRILFTSLGSGLLAKGTGGEVYTVELAGEDGIFYKATALIEGDTVLAYCKEVESPKYCRYAWNNNPHEANLYNVQGLPAAGFSSA